MKNSFSAIVCSLLLVGGCVLIEDSAEPAPGCGDDTQAWHVSCPVSLDVEPGQPLTLTLDRAPSETRLYVWLDGEDTAVALPYVEATANGAHSVIVIVPPVTDGVHTFAIGDDSGAQSNPLALRVSSPAPRLDQQQIAAVLEEGLNRFIDIPDSIIHADAAEMTELRAQLYTPEQLAKLDDMFANGRGLARAVGLAYHELSPDEHRRFFAYFQNSGMLDAFAGLITTPNWPVDNSMQSPTFLSSWNMQRALLSADTASFVLAIFNTLSDAEIVVSLASGGGAPLAAIGLGVKLTLGLAKFAIDVALPTDLHNIEIHGGENLFNGQATTLVYWGEFRPQNGKAGTIRNLDQFIAMFIDEVVPGKLASQADKLARAAFIKLQTSGLFFHAGLFQGDGDNRTDFSAIGHVKLPLDLDYYRIPVVSHISALPLAKGTPVTAFAVFLQWLAKKFDLFSPLEFSSNASLTIEKTYFERPVVSSNFAAGEDRHAVTITVSAYRLTEQDWIVTQVPRWQTIAVTKDVVLRKHGVMQTTEHFASKSIVIRTLEQAWDPARPAIYTDTSAVRLYHIGFRTDSGFWSPPRFDVYLNNQLVRSDVSPSYTGFDPRFYDFKPGWNELRIEQKHADYAACLNQPSSSGGCVTVLFPEAHNGIQTVSVMFAGSGDNKRRILIWAPPLAEPK